MRIGLTFNPFPEGYDRNSSDDFVEFDDISVANSIKAALESGGHEVIMIDCNKDPYEKLKNSNLDFVFNIAEGLRGNSRESQIPAMLEFLGIPYTASDVLTLAIALDKTKTKEILSYYKIPTPKFQLFTSSNQPLNKKLRFPLIVKPNREGSSKGITAESLVNNEEELRKRVDFVIKKYNQPALVEEFLTGREFTVSLLGNPPKVLPIVEILFDKLPDEAPKFDCYEVKWFWDSPETGIEMVKCPAEIDKKLEKKIKNIAIRTFNALGCRDLCRIDMRLDNKNIPNVLEVNPIPGLIPDPKENSRFPKSCYALGMTYNEIILSILDAAMKRFGMNGK
ncbi:MAG: ATP-grasp domain-containing protein [Candidatus Aenigmatarchaeota archaeon]